MSQPKKARLCDHVHANGAFCMSPALRRDRFCYFHLRDRQRRQLLRRLSPPDSDAATFDALDLPVFEDANAIQVAVTAVFRALGARRIKPRRAALLLYALQIAHANLPGVDFHPPADADVLERDCEPIALPEEEKKEPKATCSPSPPPPALPQPVSSG
jgi:hypothetical protein